MKRTARLMEVRRIMNSFRYWDADGEWVSRSPQEILSSRVGNCYDTVKLQDYLLDAARVEHRMFLLVPRQSLEENRGDLPTHLFVLHDDNGVWRWVEGSWQPYRDNSLAGDCAEVLAAAVKRLMEAHYGMEYLLFPVDALPAEGLTLGQFYERLLEGVLFSS